MKPRLEVRDLGRTSYAEADQLQDELVSRRQRDEIADRLLLLEHPPVITFGRRAGTQHLIASAAELERRGVELIATDRGGDITYHGPGQLVGYLIVKLEGKERSVPWLFRAVEAAICETLGQFAISARGGTPESVQSPAGGSEVALGHAGAWVKKDKICAVGMRLSSWVTKHGFALNVDEISESFQLITPCGLTGFGVTSMAELLGHKVALPQVKEGVAEALGRALGRDPVWS